MTDRPITSPEIDSYLAALLPERDEVLCEMEEIARQRRIPIVGPAVGRYLHLLARAIGARRIFEAGSAIGYSTIWLARAAGPRAEIYYSDGDPDRARDALAYFKRAGVEKRIQIQTGDALRLLRKTPGTFDLIFCDVEKEQYPAAFGLAVPRVRRGGLFLTDNVLWSGRVSESSSDQRTQAIQKFNRLVYSSRALFPVIVPLRDGVVVCHKR